ncbi:uncharacterized protein LOC116298592 [Actinia tenebrosa]|uniref:Uncharacterized protein LOC116298592 n=1 Tax=Actinia tenebrosa TaxID=6105 RepID=A0A6P8ICV0_ACTTE|nr:uncharacterized protein LOC116298592 [Actinia tenebrosa]
MAEQTASTRTVVIAVTISEHSQRAFEWYIENIHKSDDHVILFYCQAPLEQPADPYSTHTLDWQKKVRKHDDEQKEFIKFYTNKCKEFSQSAKIKIENHHRSGEHICAFAEKQNAAYIVIGKRGLSSIRRTLIGGVSDHVLSHSNIPVVLVPHAHAHHQ